MVRGTVNPKDKEPYYPYYNPALHPTIPPPARDFNIPMSRYTANIYQNDQKPYYGPSETFRKFNVPLTPEAVIKISFYYLDSN